MCSVQEAPRLRPLSSVCPLVMNENADDDDDGNNAMMEDADDVMLMMMLWHAG